MTITKRWVWVIVAALMTVQAVLVATIVHRESLTFDEADHSFAGYMMWHTGDYGLNPEHPPLVKLLATAPLLGRDLWVPTLKGIDFKAEAYISGRDWIARNDGGRNQLVYQMRLAAGLLALTVFLAAREWFGPVAGLVAMGLVVFDPTILAHSALVTTDIGVSLFFLASVYAFYRYVKQPSLARLLVAGVVSGLLLAAKHSGVLLAPMLVLLIVWEVLVAAKGTRMRAGLRLTGAFAAIVVVGVMVLWAFYGFRYAARPAGLALSTSLADYTTPIGPFSAKCVLAVAHFHLLPESYLMGLVDVKRMAQFYPTFIFGKVYTHGLWWYFPVVILIKTTLGLLALGALALFALFTGRLRKGRELVYVLVPCLFYLAVAIASGMNIGARHLMPSYTFVFVIAAAGIAALAETNRRWMWVGVGLIAAHIVSSLAVFPNPMAYANEAWGGAKNTHNLLSDANVDWAQQLLQVKAWQDRHPGEECWFSYFANPVIEPEMYGIHCHRLPNLMTSFGGGADIVPPVVNGNVIISAGDLSGCEWPSGRVNPVAQFQSIEPTESIDYGVFVYRGSFEMKQAAAMSRAVKANGLLARGNPTAALELAKEAVAIDPGEITGETALGDVSAVLGQKDAARAAWEAALKTAMQLEPDAQGNYVPDLEGKLKKL